MASLSLRAKFLSLIYAPLLFFIVSLWGCLEFWIVPKVSGKLARDRVDSVSESVDSYIQAYFGNFEEILQANQNAIDISPISEFISKLERANNNQNQHDYAKVFIIDSCGGIIAPTRNWLYLVDNNQECKPELINIKTSEPELIQERDKNHKKSLQNIIENINITNSKTLHTRNFISKVTTLKYPRQHNWLMIVAIPREAIRQEITPWITVAEILCILLAIIVGIIFWFFVVLPIINSIKSLREATRELEEKNYQLPSLKDRNDRDDELELLVKKFQQMARTISDREQIMSQQLEQPLLQPQKESNIKQGLEQLKQATDIHEKAELVMQIIEQHEWQQLINTNQDNPSKQKY